MSNACALGKETRVVGKVECTGQETALPENGDDVAKGAGMAGVDVDHFGGGGGGAGGRRWNLTSGFLDQTRDVDAVVWKNVICIGGVVPFDMCELAEV